METAYYSEFATNIIKTSGWVAVRFGYDQIEPEHLLLAMIDDALKNPTKNDNVLKLFKQLNIDLFELIEDVERAFISKKIATVPEKIPLSVETERLLKLAGLEAKRFNGFIVSAGHILLSYLSAGTAFCEKILMPKYSLTYARVKICLQEF